MAQNSCAFGVSSYVCASTYCSTFSAAPQVLYNGAEGWERERGGGGRARRGSGQLALSLHLSRPIFLSVYRSACLAAYLRIYLSFLFALTPLLLASPPLPMLLSFSFDDLHSTLPPPCFQRFLGALNSLLLMVKGGWGQAEAVVRDGRVR
eukprot:2894381-Rhodomonas_salina.1